MKGFLSSHAGSGLEEHLTLRTDALLLTIAQKFSTLLCREEDMLVFLNVKYIKEI